MWCGAAGGCSITKVGAHTAWHGGRAWLGVPPSVRHWQRCLAPEPQLTSPKVLQWVPAGSEPCYLLSEESIAGIPAVPQCLRSGDGSPHPWRVALEMPCPHPHVLAALLPPYSHEGIRSVHAVPGPRGLLQQCLHPCPTLGQLGWGMAAGRGAMRQLETLAVSPLQEVGTPPV